jgi:rubrerythrin
VVQRQLKGSKTEGNLKAAFAGESQANRRYLYFANKADVEGQNDVAALFRSTAEGETGHAHGHLEYLEKRCGDPATGLPIGATADNLKAAVAGETHEYTDMYPGMAKTARDEGFDEIADWFETLAKAERSHANRYQKALDSLNGCEKSRGRRAGLPPPYRQRRLPDPDPNPHTTAHEQTHAMREGNLEAPTRHPSTGRTPSSTTRPPAPRMERIFDICHGCRRCVSLCNAFPNLFDLVDEADDGETDGVPKEDYWKVVDQCYLCDLCYMTKCPYVPPHEWNLDFPHTMLRAKAIQFKKGKSIPRQAAGLHRLVGTLPASPWWCRWSMPPTSTGPRAA